MKYTKFMELVNEATDLERQGFASKHGLPRKAARKYAYAMARGSTDNEVKARDRYFRKMKGNAQRVGAKLDKALSDFSRRTGVPIIKEGSVKGAMEDWFYSLPQKTISHLKARHGPELRRTGEGEKPSAALMKSIHSTLKAHKVPKLLGSHKEGAKAIAMSFHTFHGDM